MEKGLTRKGRKSKYGSVRNSGSEDNMPASELLNGGSDKEKISEDTPQASNVDESSDLEASQIKAEPAVEDGKPNSTEASEFHGFDEPPDASGASVLNELVGKYEADLGDEPSEKEDKAPLATSDAQDEHKVLGHDIYTDSEDESPKQAKGAKQLKASSKKRPLEKLAEEFIDDEKPTTPPAKRARKKSAKLREASGDSSDNMKLLSDVSSEVTSSVDVPRKSKAKDEPVSDVTSSGGQGKKSRDSDAARRGRHPTRDINDPIFLKPLDQGWKRELVYRGTGPKGQEGKRTGDIYYYTPEGKKVRSRIEILEHLRGSDLKTENFCFLKEPLGIDDPAKEIVREASSKKLSMDAIPAKREKSPKIPKQKAGKGASSADSPAVSDDTSNASAAGSNGPSASPPKDSSGAKAITPRVVLKTQKQSPKGPKAKITPSRKSNADSPPTKGKVGRPKKEKEVPQVGEDGAEVGALSSNWDSSEQQGTELNSANASTGWKTKPKRVKLSDGADATVESSTTAQGKAQGKRNMENFISDLSNGYGALFHVMGYLKVQELLRASRVCRMWRDLSLHPNLWHTVRMKNSQVSDWDGFAAAISARGTRVLDLRKMLAPGSAEDIQHMWSEFCRVIGQADSLQRVELSRCPASVFEQLAIKCPQLRVINAVAIKSEEVDLETIRNVPLLEELRLKSHNGMNITKSLEPLHYCRLKHLSLTSVKNLGSCNVEIIGELQNLESLELGECVKLSNSFGPDHLSKLTKLQRLRLEKGQVPGCPVISIIESIAQLPALTQLEIINFDVKPGFDKALAMCKQLRRLLIIPTYITTSASTNHIVLCSLPSLADSLEYLVWGLTQELTRVTDLFIDQCDARKGAPSSTKLKYPGECIPVVKPVLSDENEKKPENGESEDNKDSEKMDVDEEKKESEEGKECDEKKIDDPDTEVESLARDFRILSSMEQQVESNPVPPVRILPIPTLRKLLVQLLPNTRVKILKVPFLSTWRQTFPEMSSF